MTEKEIKAKLDEAIHLLSLSKEIMISSGCIDDAPTFKGRIASFIESLDSIDSPTPSSPDKPAKGCGKIFKKNTVWTCIGKPSFGRYRDDFKPGEPILCPDCQAKQAKPKANRILEATTNASGQSLAKDWARPEEIDAWKDLGSTDPQAVFDGAPDWAEWYAVDEDGLAGVYEHEPVQFDGRIWRTDVRFGLCKHTIKGPTPADWTKTKVKRERKVEVKVEVKPATKLDPLEMPEYFPGSPWDSDDIQFLWDHVAKLTDRINELTAKME